MQKQSLSQREAIDQALAENADKPGALLPVLHGVQHALGYIPGTAVARVAEGLNLSRAEVHGVISFYHHFRTTPPGRHVIQICRAEACQSMGSVHLERHVKDRLGVDYHATTSNSHYTLEPVYCLGNCACSPSIMIDDAIHARVTLERFNELLDEIEAGEVV